MSNAAIFLIGIAAIVLAVVIGRVRAKADPSAFRWPLYARVLLNQREQVMYHRLEQTYPEHRVLVQVALSQLLGIEAKIKQRQALFNGYRQLVADFVLCDRAFRPVAVIELDGLSHDQPRRQDADRRKEHAVRSAGVIFLRINAARIPDGRELRELLLPLNSEPVSTPSSALDDPFIGPF